MLIKEQYPPSIQKKMRIAEKQTLQGVKILSGLAKLRLTVFLESDTVHMLIYVRVLKGRGAAD